jgi:hypothetical protein
LPTNGRNINNRVVELLEHGLAAFDRDEVKLHIQSAHGDLMVTEQQERSTCEEQDLLRV